MEKLIETSTRYLEGKLEDAQNFDDPQHPYYHEYYIHGEPFPPIEFKNRLFTEDINFYLHELSGVLPSVRFENCTFAGKVNFSDLTIQSLGLVNCTFQRSVSFIESMIEEFYCVSTVFLRAAGWEGAEFKLRMHFLSCSFSGATFEDAIFNKYVIFQNCDVRKFIDFSNIIVDPGMLSIVRVPVEKLQLAVPDIAQLRYEALSWPDWDTVESTGVLDEDMCRAWKNKARVLGDEMLASHWHMLEKEFMKRRMWNQKSYFLSIVLWGYRQLSMYGESPVRAAACLVILLAIPFLASLAGLYSVDYALAGLPFFSKAAPSIVDNSTNLKVFWLTSQGAITLQLSLLFFAIRNKLRR